jgi:CSLREA domain-containing protein
VKPVRIVVLVLAVACAFPAGASALDLEVNTLNDPGDGSCFEAESECSLRGAIYAADASEVPDTISFEVAGTIKPGTPLPELEGSITLDATTAPGWKGSPVVYLDGSEAEFEGGTWGIRVRENSSANIYGLGIGEFGLGIWFEPSSSGRACGNYIGTDLSGTLPRPNFDGVWVGEGTGLVQVGRMCPEAIGGNLISGNAEFGVVVAGTEVEVDQNLIGTDASGTTPLPNGPPPETVEPFGGGILVTPTAIFINIGGIDDTALPHNVIAFNAGPGILVETGAQLTTIRENSIHSNSGLGIENEASTVTPEISSIAEIVNLTTTVAGTVTGAPNTEYELEFFASEECDPSGFGEGRFFTASTNHEVETDDSGNAEFNSTLGLVLPGAHFFTLTATDHSRNSTSEFSNCVFAETAAEREKSQPPPPPPSPPTPVNGKSVTVALKSGRVLIKVPGSNKFVPLGDLQSIPVGSIVDATNGRVTLTSIDANGVEQSADFYEGRFQISQAAGGALVTLRLRGGDFSSCPTAGSSARASKRSGRKLWGSGSGRFRTQGNFGSASVRGTIWLTADQCNGTLFKVRRGVVKVTDFALDKTISLPAGKTYLAVKP